ncbi:MAG: hypothetical protein ACXWLM_10645, partial [Myxococcales bacterium]
LAELPRRALAGVAVATIAAAAWLMHLPSYVLHPRFSPRWDATALPVRAATFLNAAGLTGPGFNSFYDGGYLEMTRGRAFIDGRIDALPPDAFRALNEAEQTPQKFQAYLRDKGCEWALTTRQLQALGGYRRLDGPDWALVYWDDVNELFVRRDLPALSAVRERFEYRFFRPYGEIVGGVEKLAPGDLPLLLAELDRFERTTPAYPFAAIERCAALTRLGTPDAPAACDRAAARTPPRFAPLVARARSLR